MIYYVYILKSLIKEWYYIGQTSDLDKRVVRHNAGRVHSTKNYRPFKLIRYEQYETRQEAMKRELLIKSYKNGNAFKKLIE